MGVDMQMVAFLCHQSGCQVEVPLMFILGKHRLYLSLELNGRNLREGYSL